MLFLTLDDLLTRSFQKHTIKNLNKEKYSVFSKDVTRLQMILYDLVKWKRKLTTVAPIFSVLRLFRERRLIVSPFLSAGFKFSLCRDRECLVLVALSCLTIRSIN